MTSTGRPTFRGIEEMREYSRNALAAARPDLLEQEMQRSRQAREMLDTIAKMRAEKRPLQSLRVVVKSTKLEDLPPQEDRAAIGRKEADEFGKLVMAGSPIPDASEIAFVTGGSRVQPSRPPPKRRTPLQVLAAIAICDDCDQQKLFDNDAPGCKLVCGTCGSNSPLAFKRYVESGYACRHRSGDKWSGIAEIDHQNQQFQTGTMK